MQHNRSFAGLWGRGLRGNGHVELGRRARKGDPRGRGTRRAVASAMHQSDVEGGLGPALHLELRQHLRFLILSEREWRALGIGPCWRLFR